MRIAQPKLGKFDGVRLISVSKSLQRMETRPVRRKIFEQTASNLRDVAYKFFFLSPLLLASILFDFYTALNYVYDSFGRLVRRTLCSVIGGINFIQFNDVSPFIAAKQLETMEHISLLNWISYDHSKERNDLHTEPGLERCFHFSINVQL